MSTVYNVAGYVFVASVVYAAALAIDIFFLNPQRGNPNDETRVSCFVVAIAWPISVPIAVAGALVVVTTSILEKGILALKEFMEKRK